MYNQITANKQKSVLLIALFVLVVMGLGWFAGEITESGYTMLVYAAALSLVMTLFSYYSGDRVALWTSGAQPITKNENTYLYRIVENLCITAGTPTPKIHIINDSAINAFATGRNPQHASIAVTTGALEKLTNEELEGVIAHELSHIKNYDIRVMTIVIVLVGTISLLADLALRMQFHGGRGRDRNAPPALAIVGLVLMILSPLIAELIKLAVSRKREYLADASGALLTRYPEGLAAALEKIQHHNTQPMARANHATAHLYLANPFGPRLSKLFGNLFSTHPPLENRIKILRKMGT